MSTEESTAETTEDIVSAVDNNMLPDDDAPASEAVEHVPTTPLNPGNQETPQWQPINARQRRLLGVMMEKAKTTPDAYPLSLSGLVTGANQKSNRAPLMNLTPEQCEDKINVLRRIGAAAEIQGAGRVPKYRHYGHTWLGVKGAEAAVMIELLLRGQQTAGDLRTRASRFEPIADLGTLQTLLNSLIEKKLVIALTPAGRGQLFTHNLYPADELAALRVKVATAAEGDEADAAPARPTLSSQLAAAQQEIAHLKAENERLRTEIESLKA